MEQHQNYLFVYDPKLKNYLLEHGMRYITVAKSISTDERFWLFYRSKELKSLLDEFNAVKS